MFRSILRLAVNHDVWVLRSRILRDYTVAGKREN